MEESMQSLLLAAAVLACPVSMGFMMWKMRSHTDTRAAGTAQHCTVVGPPRAGIESLKYGERNHNRHAEGP